MNAIPDRPRNIKWPLMVAIIIHIGVFVLFFLGFHFSKPMIQEPVSNPITATLQAPETAAPAAPPAVVLEAPKPEPEPVQERSGPSFVDQAREIEKELKANQAALAQEKAKQEQEAKKKAADEAAKQAAAKKAEDEAKRKAAEQAKLTAAKKAEETAKRQAEEAAKRQADAQRKEAERQAKLEAQEKKRAEDARLAQIEAEKRARAEKERQQQEKRRVEQERVQAQLDAERRAAEIREQALAQQQTEAEYLAHQAWLDQQQAQETVMLGNAQAQARRNAELAASERGLQSAAYAQYIAAIKGKVTSRWVTPGTLAGGERCEVTVSQTPGGYIENVQIVSCVGEESFRESVWNAVWKSEPLPPPPTPEVFDREIHFNFTPGP